MEIPLRRRARNRVFTWNPKFGMRQQKSYAMDRTQIGRHRGQASIIETFFKESRFDLEPPQQSCLALRQFLEQADEDDLLREPVTVDEARILALVDERCDRTGWKDSSGQNFYSRDWLQYAQNPPAGDCLQQDIFHARGLYLKLEKPDVRRTPLSV